MSTSNNNKIILFDGVCNLCNSSVNFVIKHDKKNVFKFAALQSEAGIALISKHKEAASRLDSIVLIEDNKFYEKSTAILRIVKHFSGAYPLLYGFIIIPKFLRNPIYDYIAQNRYKWFGKKDSCMIPTSQLKAKFL